MTTLLDILGLQGGGVISIVGGGGKTSLMERLAREILVRGETVLMTTTTKILMPHGDQSAPVIISQETDELLKQAKKLRFQSGFRCLTAARAHLPDQDKLFGFGIEDIAKIELGNLFNWILVEADGARHRPLKAPAAHEPVIPPCSRWVIAVAGMDAVGKPLTDEWVFRSRLFADLVGLAPGAEITAQSVAIALCDEAGIMKGGPSGAVRCVFLNKVETEARRQAGLDVVRFLREMKLGRPARVVVGALEREAEPLECYELS